jgi:glucose-6-phosphate 1-dehydrogenase
MVNHMAGENPFHDPLRFERKVPECAVVIFGANGDLTKRKLMPALYRLAFERRLSPGFAVIGISRTPMSDDQFREKMRESVQKFLEDSPFDENVWSSFAQGLFYMAGNVDDAKCYTDLKQCLEGVEKQRRTGGNVLFYLSTQPSQYGPTATGLGVVGLNKGDGWRRLVVEKPFGHDLASSRELSTTLHKVFVEEDLYRIDHYLGKETVQNILALRFGNGIFEPLWNRRYISHVQITAAESIGVEGRGAYYQEAGALRDMIQNHLLQVMATVTMEPSASFQPNSVRDERSKLLRSVRVMRPGTPWRASMDRRAWAAKMCPVFGRSKAWIRNRKPIPMRLQPSLSITGDGPRCPSTYAAASGCQNASAKFPFSSTKRLTPFSETVSPRRPFRTC